MGKEKEIEIKYKNVRKEPSGVQRDEKNNPSEELRQKLIQNYHKWIKVFSLIFSIIFLFMIISVISYSPKDEFVTSFSIKDYFYSILGKEEILDKFKQISNIMGPAGALVSHLLINKTIGYFSIVFPILLLAWSIKILITKKVSGRLAHWTISLLAFAFCLSALIGSINLLFQISIPFYWIGSVGYFLSTVTANFIGRFGSFSFYFILLFLIPIFSFDISIERYILNFINSLKSLKIRERDNKDSETTTNMKSTDEKEQEKGVTNGEFLEEQQEDKETAQILIRSFDSAKIEEEIPNVENVSSEESNFEEEKFSENSQNSFTPVNEENSVEKLVVVVEEIEEEPKDDDEKKNNIFSPISTLALDEKINYTPPPIDLLIDDESRFQISEEELKQNAKLLQEKLETFKIYIENLTVTPGPVVTQYEFVPAPGIKISRIQSLADDIALGLKAKGIRIIAPVPGKGTVGIEIPNKKPIVVRFGNCLKNAKINPNFHLPIILGKTISGEVFVEDLARMPHLLIAGATGSGKSVGINTIIASLIYRMHPQNLKFVIIDPKKVELTHYQQLLYHFLAVSPEIEDAIVTEPADAVLVLKALIAEMQSRYDILASVQQKNIFEYNKKVREGLFRNDPEFIHRPMPYIVTIIDELADLMLTTGKEIEALIIRLAQLARAVGIHLVVATQRPSVDIITGLIKANFPARIAYLVASRVDSRTIIDTIGAEQLLGNGDMLFLPSGWPNPIRIQNAFLTTEEIERICDFIGNQKGYSKPYYLPKVEEAKSGKESFDREGFDPLFEEAARLIIRHQQASVSMLQRRLKIGYNRAGRIMDELEMAGIVGPFDGSKGRTIKISTEDELDKFLSEKGL